MHPFSSGPPQEQQPGPLPVKVPGRMVVVGRGAGTMSVYPELDGLGLAELVACFRGPPLDGPEYADSYYIEVAYLIAQQGEDGLAFLQGALQGADTPRLRALIFALTSAPGGTPALRDCLLAWLEDD